MNLCNSFIGSLLSFFLWSFTGNVPEGVFAKISLFIYKLNKTTFYTMYTQIFYRTKNDFCIINNIACNSEKQ